jgi:DNA-directed RNA polymerase subunit RPC12/RpoP
MPNPHREYEEARRMLVRAVASVKAGEIETAERYLHRILGIPSTSDQKADTYYWLAEISKNPEEKRGHLKISLGYNSTHHRARKALAILDGKINPAEMINPDSYRQPVPDGPLAADGERFVCPQCGGRMIFSPDGESLVCEYCEEEKISAGIIGIQEIDFVVGMSTAVSRNKALATLSFECKACGAIFLLPPETISLTCPHCDSVYAINETETRELIPPEGIIPFKFDAEEAEKLARGWVKKQFSLSKVPRLAALTGIYLPAWTFDISGFVGWKGTEYENERFYEISGKEIISYDDIFVAASAPLPAYFNELLAEFSAQDVLPYKAEYTANWLAETYKTSMSDAALTARLLAFTDSQKMLSRQEKLRHVSGLRFTSDEMMIASFKLVLVPVWIGHIKIDRQDHELTINGSSGRVFGPKPPGKLQKLAQWLLGN